MIYLTKKRRNSFRQKVAFALAMIMLAETAAPSLMFGLTSGPSAPEFSSFEPVATTNMVDEFSGDFTYNIPVLNIPGANGGGYAMSLSYHSGEAVEGEASWVGYGWTLNPGAINRGKRGFADDTKNSISYYNDVPKNWTVTTGATVGNIELFSFGIPISANASVRYNNYRGFGYTAGAGLSFRQGLVTLGYSVSDGSGSFSAQVNPAALLNKNKEATEEEQAKSDAYKAADKGGKPQAKKDYQAVAKQASATDKKKANAANSAGRLANLANAYGMHAIGEFQQPTTITPYSGFSFNTKFSLQTNPAPLEIGPQFGFIGNYNHQKNTPQVDRLAMGYLYSGEAYALEETVMDYYLEREATYNKRDRYMSIPFSNADLFSVTGEGLGGGFRLYNQSLGYFRPNEARSQTKIAQVSADLCLGYEFGVGVDVGVGLQTLDVDGEWGNNTGDADDYAFPTTTGVATNDRHFLRFNNDLGGDVIYDASDGLLKADVVVDSWVPGAKRCHPQLGSGVPKLLQSEINVGSSTVDRSGRASYIAYHTNTEMGIVSSGTSKPVYASERSADLLSSTTLINRANYPDHIGEIVTVNEDGNTYVYGLPVYVKNETNMQYDLRGIAGSAIENNFRAENDISSPEMKIGQIDHGGYASSYLLTQITTPDYVDRTLDGPSLDDFGGYTQFKYTKHHNVDGGTGYHYRMPYSGLNYSKADMTDPADDMGSYSSGDKDVAYLDRIVTKTHIAVFIASTRPDGLEAAADGTAAADFDAKGTGTLKQLDEIALYVNDNGALGKLIKKVHFEYDHSLCGGIPNSTTVGSTNGKLTLKSLWFEYDGIVTAKISPYKFQYEYPANTVSDYPTKYDDFQTEYGDLTLTENPPYSPFATDAWGNYQDATTGAARFALMKAGLNQATGVTGPPSTFDPAAWQLKVIQLPSGGEIHVQYEQDRYSYVQNRRAECLVSIDETDEENNTGTYTLNTDEIGVTSAPDKAALVQLINERYSGDKIYFKFLYALIGGSPGVNECNSDYITGYVNFMGASIVSGEVVITVGDGTSYDLPRDICLDLVKKQKGGKLNPDGNCNASADGVSDGLSIKDMVMQLISKIGTSFFADNTSCLSVNAPLSYFKIPVLHPKKGGGLRVKRILMYDENGIDTGVSSLYGSEYFYQNEDGSCSGVCTNEPAPLRDENALITFLPKRNEQSFVSKVISGTDREQFEGPIGESLLPSASVGYSRVVTKNIHSGKTNTGFVVSQFYTVKDYPFDMRYGGITDAITNTSVDKEKDWMNLPAIVASYCVTNIWASQGYRFILNSMHGQPKAVSTYSGDLVSGTLTSYAPSSSTEYQYFQPGEAVQVQDVDGVGTTSQYPGKDMEVTFEIKSVEDVTEDASLEIDFGLGLAGVIPLPQASASPLVTYTESKLRTHVTSKVIKYPAIQKAVISMQDGIVHRTENLVFSAYTGKPVKTRTTDGYDGELLDLPSPSTPHNGAFTSRSNPAYMEYKEMGQKAINERLLMAPGTAPWDHISINASKVGTEYFLSFTADPGYSVCDAMGALTRGDLIKVTGGGQYFHIDEISGSSIEILPAVLLNSPPSSFSYTDPQIEIIKSGRTNQLSTMAGNYVTYGADQTIDDVVADPLVTADRDAFITALNATLPSGGTIDLTSFPSVVKNDASCSELEGEMMISAIVGGSFTIHTEMSNLLLNGNFSSHTCTGADAGIEFRAGCVTNWLSAYGPRPQFGTGPTPPSALLQCKNPADGLLQNGVVLDPAKQYTISFNLLSTGGVNGDLYAYLANPSTSGLPLSSASIPPLTSPPGQQILNYDYVAGTTPYVVSLPFTPASASNTQLYIFGDDPSTLGQGLTIDNIRLGEVACIQTLSTNGTGHYDYDEAGNILYYSPDNDCYPQVLECIKFCDAAPSAKTLENVITASAATFDCSWPYDSNVYPFISGTNNVYETGEKGKWRTKESFVYKAPVTGGATHATERNYNDAGVFTMTLFNWKYPSFNESEKWVKTSSVTQYSPNGDAMEETDALGIYSAAKFGYNGTVPYLVSQNSKYDHVQFQSFEKKYTTVSPFKLEDGLSIPSVIYYNPSSANIAHSGKGSCKLTKIDYTLSMKSFTADAHLQSKGLSLKVWVKDASWSASPLTAQLTATAGPGTTFSTPFIKVAQTGEWTLFEARALSLVSGTTYTPVLINNLTTNIYLDDVRLQPMDAQMNAYVYDPATLRLLAKFDDQHFGLYYQYNQEGKLVRKIVETEKGMKTITETQYHSPSEARP